MKKAALIFFRHGNTFEKGQTPVWVGARTDMPLTAEGEKQAFAAATYIEQHFAPVMEITAGPLQRTHRFAEIIAEQIRLDFTVDGRLREIDYGKWEELDRIAICQRFGSAELEDWEKDSKWPKNMDWQPPFDALNASLDHFLREQNGKLTAAITEAPEGAYNVAVTSNGILRLIYRLVTGKPCRASEKVKTGHACVLAPDGEDWQIMAWNEDPVKAKIAAL